MRTSSMLAWLAATTLCGCSPAPLPQATPDAGSNAPACPEWTHLGDDGCEASLSWSDGPSLPKARDHHGTAITAGPDGAYLHVFGGTPDHMSAFDDAYRARLGDDGSLAEWETLAPLPQAMTGHSTSVVDRWVVLASGATNAGGSVTLSPRTFVAHVADDGTLESWRMRTPLPEARFHHAAAVHGRRLYLSGGMDVIGMDGHVSDQVWSTEVDDTGKLGEWRTERALPATRSHHAAFVHEGRLYLLGGLTGNPSTVSTEYDDVLRADLQADGSLGEWSVAGKLAAGVTTTAAVIHAGHVWIFGGVAQDKFIATVRRAPLLPDGHIGAWEEVEPLPFGRGHVHQMPFYKGHLYSTAGRTGLSRNSARVTIGLFE